MKDTKKIILTAIRVIVALTAIGLIILSMVKDQIYPYLAIGLGLTFISNTVNCIQICRRKERENGSAEDRSFS